MTKTQDEFYQFAIDPLNFEAICDIVENFKDVRERIVYDFWTEVKARFESVFANKGEWKIYLSPFEDYGEFLIYHERFAPATEDDYPDFCVSVEKIYGGAAYYGLWLNPEVKSFNMEKVRNLAKDYRLSGWKMDGTAYAYYKYLPDDFKAISIVRKLGPGNRTIVVEQYANLLGEAVNELEPFINKYILKKK